MTPAGVLYERKRCPQAAIRLPATPFGTTCIHTTDRATFFHSSAWARVLSESYGYVPRYFTIIDNRKLAGLIPVMEIDSFLTGKRGVTLPFTDICHPIADTPEIFQVLMERLTQHGKSAGWKHIEIKGGSAFLGKAVPSSADHITHVLELSADEDTTTPEDFPGQHPP